MPFVELADNLIQLVVALIATVWAGILAVREKEQKFFLLFCGYGCYVLGLVFWILYLVLMTYTPKIFYVSDLSWIGAWLFFLCLELSLVGPEERQFRPLIAWLAPLIIMGFAVLYIILAGEMIATFVWGVVMAACGYFALRGWLYARKQTGMQRQMQHFHIAMLLFLTAEHALFTSSCFFKDAGITNPYFLIDQFVTLSLIYLIPALKKGVLHDVH